MHGDGDFAGQRHLGFLYAASPGNFHGPAFNAVQPLSGLVSMMLVTT
jgi:hypothetical protein